MYICQVTGKYSRQGKPGPTDKEGHVTQIPGEKLNKIVIATRERIYTKWVKNEETHKYEEVEAGRGWEIVREINASDEGLALWNSWSPEERAVFVKHLGS